MKVCSVALLVLGVACVGCVGMHAFLEGVYSSRDGYFLNMSVCFNATLQMVSGIINRSVIFYGMSSSPQSSDNFEIRHLTGIWYRAGIRLCDTGSFSLELYHPESGQDPDILTGNFTCDADQSVVFSLDAERIITDTPSEEQCALSSVEPHATRGLLTEYSMRGAWDDISFEIFTTTQNKMLEYAYSGYAKDPTFGIEMPVYGEGNCFTGGTICQGIWYMGINSSVCWRFGSELWYILEPNMTANIWWANQSTYVNFSLINSANFHGLRLLLYRSHSRFSFPLSFCVVAVVFMRVCMCWQKSFREKIWSRKKMSLIICTYVIFVIMMANCQTQQYCGLHRYF